MYSAAHWIATCGGKQNIEPKIQEFGQVQAAQR
jgi:hypothetical protein